MRQGLSVAGGDLQLLDGRWYVTHSGLLRIAQRRRCCGIKAVLQERLSDPAANRWIFKATVYKSPGSKGFVGYGDADPSNVSPLVRRAEMRVAETRAVNRALRKAYGIGLCSVEELGWLSAPTGADHKKGGESAAAGQNGSNNGQPRLRDRLCLLVRQHQLDATLIKLYASVSAVPGKQPLNRLPKLLTDPHQNLRPNFLLAALYVRKVSLTPCNPPCESLLRHVEASEFPDPPPDTVLPYWPSCSTQGHF